MPRRGKPEEALARLGAEVARHAIQGPIVALLIVLSVDDAVATAEGSGPAGYDVRNAVGTVREGLLTITGGTLSNSKRFKAHRPAGRIRREDFVDAAGPVT